MPPSAPGRCACPAPPNRPRLLAEAALWLAARDRAPLPRGGCAMRRRLLAEEEELEALRQSGSRAWSARGHVKLLARITRLSAACGTTG